MQKRGIDRKLPQIIEGEEENKSAMSVAKNGNLGESRVNSGSGKRDVVDGGERSSAKYRKNRKLTSRIFRIQEGIPFRAIRTSRFG